MNQNAHPVVIMAGGTGGHVFPGIAVARGFQARGVPVVWLGTRSGLEARLVPEAGIRIEWLDVAGLRGKGLGRVVTAPLMLGRALWQAALILRRLRPRLAVGMGGFASGPGDLMSWLLWVPLVVHEQNAIAGLTNRILARFAARIFEAFPNSFPASDRVETIGNPVREEIAGLAAPEARLRGRSGPTRLLVLGGSQGARALNEMVPAALAGLSPDERPQVRHQAGGTMIRGTRESYARFGIQAEITPFIDSMAEAYGWADLVICRSGALTVCELAAAGLASVLVPFPFAVDDHQRANGRLLEDAGAAVLIPESDLTPERLQAVIQRLASDRGALARMAAAARRLARPDATERLVEGGLRHARTDQ